MANAKHNVVSLSTLTNAVPNDCDFKFETYKNKVIEDLKI